MKHTYIFKDLGYTVIAEAREMAVEYEIYEIAGIYADGQATYFLKGDPGFEPVDAIEQAQLFAHGSVKWDGCSNWYFDEQDEVMLHGCDRGYLTGIGEILATCWDLTKSLCPFWQIPAAPELADRTH